MRIVVIAVMGCALGAIVSFGCKSDPEAPKSRRGEACQVSADCADGLGCQPFLSGGGGMCVIATFPIVPTGKECGLVECATSADCCPTAPDNCNSLLALCAEDAGPPSASACAQYAAECGCSIGTRLCEANKCVSHCATDDDCVAGGTGLGKCSGGTCVQCIANTDCSDPASCNNGRCEPSCSSDGDCAGFERCLDGRCIDSGCLTDRECVSATGNVESACGTDGTCITPCETDLECSTPKAYNFMACVDKKCVATGCESDKDCRLLLTSTGGTVLPDKQHVVCRDKPTRN